MKSNIQLLVFLMLLQTISLTGCNQKRVNNTSGSGAASFIQEMMLRDSHTDKTNSNNTIIKNEDKKAYVMPNTELPDGKPILQLDAKGHTSMISKLIFGSRFKFFGPEKRKNCTW